MSDFFADRLGQLPNKDLMNWMCRAGGSIFHTRLLIRLAPLALSLVKLSSNIPSTIKLMGVGVLVWEISLWFDGMIPRLIPPGSLGLMSFERGVYIRTTKFQISSIMRDYPLIDT